MPINLPTAVAWCYGLPQGHSRVCDRPLYDPAEVARLVQEQQYEVPEEAVLRKLINRNIDAADKIEELLMSLETHGTFVKQLPLDNERFAGRIADVYRVWSSEDEDQGEGSCDWYVKFFVENGLLVVVLSCKWWDAPQW